MKKFDFRLQKVLELARREADSARSAMAIALGQLADAEAKEKAVRDRIAAADNRLRDTLRAGRIDANEVARHHSFRIRLEENAASAAERRSEAEVAYEEATRILIEKKKKLVSFERARENAWLEWRQESERRELQDLEEIASQRFVRAMKERIDS